MSSTAFACFFRLRAGAPNRKIGAFAAAQSRSTKTGVKRRSDEKNPKCKTQKQNAAIAATGSSKSAVPAFDRIGYEVVLLRPSDIINISKGALVGGSMTKSW